MDLITTNKYQTKITEELKDSLPKEVWLELSNYIDSVQFIQNLIATEDARGHAIDLPRWEDPNEEDDEYKVLSDTGRITVDLVNPHILEDMDFFRERALFFIKHKKYTHLIPNPSKRSEYAAFWREELRRWKNGLTRPSDGEWIPGAYYFYLNYSPIWLNEDADESGINKKKKRVKGVRKKLFPKPWLGDYLWFHYMQKARDSGEHCKLLKKRGCGFEQPNNEIVMTPNGETTMGEIRPGDFVMNPDGGKTKVLEVFPQGKKKVYEVELQDGRVVTCGENHLWEVYNTKNNKNIVTTKYLSKFKLKRTGGKGAYKYHLPEINPVNYPKKDLSIPPYVLGFLIGDGCINADQCKFTTADPEIVEYLQKLLPDYTIRKLSDIQYVILTKTSGVHQLLRDIREMGLNKKSYDKFIPNDYKYSSIEDRMELLRGLNDSDGTVSKGVVRFVSSSIVLITDYVYLCRSLGIRTKKPYETPGKKNVLFPNGVYSDTRKVYTASCVTQLPVFKLKRKLDGVRSNRKYNYSNVAIKEIRLTNKVEESSCILVENENHLYLTRNFIPTHNSFKFGAISPHSMYINPGLPNFHLASDKMFLEGDKGVFSKVVDTLDWVGENTPFPKLRLVDRPLEKKLGRKMGPKEEGIKSSVFGVSLRNDPDKARGVRGPIIQYEEDGMFPDIVDAWMVNLEATEDGGVVFGTMIAGGTGGTEGANFEGSEKLFYNPTPYHIYGLPNVFDKNAKLEKKCGFFWGAYLNRARCYDELNGEPDVIKALIEVLMDRYLIRQSSSDPRTITKRMAEQPITPSEAVMRTSGTLFPVADLKSLRDDIKMEGESFYSTHYSGELIADKNGNIKWTPSDKMPIRSFPIGRADPMGSIEIFQMPQRDSNGVIHMRYILGADPVDDDSGVSLCSVFVFDTFTQTIVAEYTGRPKFADDFYEIARRLTIFYNGSLMYENNKKGLFAYFSQKNCVHLLADVPQLLLDKEMMKSRGYGNKAKGFNASANINSFLRRLQRDWMLYEANYLFQEFEGEDQVTHKLNMHTIRSVAYIDELIAWNPLTGNYDRVSAMGGVMLLNAERKKNLDSYKTSTNQDSFTNNKYFAKNYGIDFSYNKKLNEKL